MTVVAAMAVVTLGASAQAAVIDFEALCCFPNSYVDDGFQLATDGLFYVAGAGTGQTMFPAGTSQLNTLSVFGGGNFDLVSIDLSELNGSVGPQTVTFQGNLFGGGTVSQTFTTDGPFGLQTFNFSGFTNLVSVSWDQIDPTSFLMYDNIVANTSTVPVRRNEWSAVKGLYR
jgi:hypothetical protein